MSSKEDLFSLSEGEIRQRILMLEFTLQDQPGEPPNCTQRARKTFEAALSRLRGELSRREQMERLVGFKRKPSVRNSGA
jgi:hypothetical protein